MSPRTVDADVFLVTQLNNNLSYLFFIKKVQSS